METIIVHHDPFVDNVLGNEEVQMASRITRMFDTRKKTGEDCKKWNTEHPNDRCKVVRYKITVEAVK